MTLQTQFDKTNKEAHKHGDEQPEIELQDGADLVCSEARCISITFASLQLLSEKTGLEETS